MIVIKPVVVNSGNLTASTIPEPDASQGEVVFNSNLNDAKYTPSTLTSYGLASDGVEDYSLIFNSGWFIETYTSGALTNTSSSITTTNALQDLTYFSGGVFATDRTSVRRYDLTGDTDKLVTISGGTEAGTSFTALVEISGQFFIYDKTHKKVRLYDYDGDQTLTHSGIDFIADLGNNPKITSTDDGGFAVLINNVTSLYNSEFDLLSSVTMDFLTSSEVSVNGISRVGSNYNIINKSQGLVKNYSSILTFNGLYSIGDRVISTSTHTLYEAVVATIEDPVVGVGLVPPSWVAVQPTNKYTAFDDVISTQSISQLTQIVEITPAQIIGGVAAINISGASFANVTMTDPIDGIVYNRDVDLNNNINIINWFNYLWTGFDFKTEFVLLDLPPYADAVTKITFTGAGEIGVGALVIGPSITLGVTNYGTNVQQLDFNKYEEDQFGNVQVIPRPYAKLVNFVNTVPKANLPYVFNQLEQLRGVAAVWVGDETDENDFTLVYGSHRDNTLNIDSPTACSVPLQIRGRI